MTKDKLPRRPLFWEGDSKKVFKMFPVTVQKDMGVALFLAQIGGMAPSAKPWKGLGSGIFELVEDHRGDTYRAVYLVRMADSIHVLHAFQKKSKSGVKTPRTDTELIEQRMKRILQRYSSNNRN
jgi:phage-related protein